MTEYTVPVIDPESGDGWDVEVEAESPREAIQKAGESEDKMVHIAKPFLDKHMDIEHPQA